MAQPSPLSGPAIILGLVCGAGLMQLFIAAGLAIPGYASTTKDARRVGTGATIGVALAVFVTSAASALLPGALAVLPVALAAVIAGLFLVLIPNLVRSARRRGCVENQVRSVFPRADEMKLLLDSDSSGHVQGRVSVKSSARGLVERRRCQR